MAFFKLSELEQKQPLPGGSARFVHSAHMTVAYWNLEAGTVIPSHSHPHEQIVNLLEGEFEFAVDGVQRRMEAGHVAVVPAHATHIGKALTPCRVIDIFYPVREDFKANG
jgi:quercetin dioxygenase-like cupin family protein